MAVSAFISRAAFFVSEIILGRVSSTNDEVFTHINPIVIENITNNQKQCAISENK